jgi:hypothetical protein
MLLCDKDFFLVVDMGGASIIESSTNHSLDIDVLGLISGRNGFAMGLGILRNMDIRAFRPLILFRTFPLSTPLSPFFALRCFRRRWQMTIVTRTANKTGAPIAMASISGSGTDAVGVVVGEAVRDGVADVVLG